MGLTECGAACADLMTDRMHCGRCDRACPGDRDCRAGACVCPEGTTECNGQCVDTNTDRNNCGICGRVCGADEFCSTGTCECMGGNRETSCLDGEDNDCDMLIDCMDDDCIGASRPCMGMCGQGAETCEGSGVWGVCEGGNGEMEICGDGIDQDCDGSDLRMPDSFEPNNDCSTCKLVSATADPNITIMGSFDSVDDDVDCYEFEADDGNSYREHIRLGLTNIPMGHDYDLVLYASEADCNANEPLASSLEFDNADESIDWGERFGSDDSGTYYIRVLRFQGFTCSESYSLTIDGLR